VRKPTTSAIVAIVLLFISIFLVMTVGRLFGLVILPMVLVAVLLAAFFDWRAKLRNRIVAGRDDDKKAA
jgi:hypothetical protein